MLSRHSFILFVSKLNIVFSFIQAESKYADLAEKEQHDGWQYFKRFKMKLHGNKVRFGFF